MFFEEDEKTVRIVDGEGNYILKSGAEDRLFESNNLFTSLSIMNTDKALDDIRLTMREGREAYAEATDGKKNM